MTEINVTHTKDERSRLSNLAVNKDGHLTYLRVTRTVILAQIVNDAPFKLALTLISGLLLGAWFTVILTNTHVTDTVPGARDLFMHVFLLLLCAMLTGTMFASMYEEAKAKVTRR